MSAVAVLPERLAALGEVVLSAEPGGFRGPWLTVLQAVNWLCGEPLTQEPSSVSRVLARYCLSLNELWADGDRQRLLAFVPRMVGTAGDGGNVARRYLALDWLVRVHTVAWLERAGLVAEARAVHDLDPLVDRASVAKAAPVVQQARAAAVVLPEAPGPRRDIQEGYAAHCVALSTGDLIKALGDPGEVEDVVHAASWDITTSCSLAVTGDIAAMAAGLRDSGLDLLDKMLSVGAPAGR